MTAADAKRFNDLIDDWCVNVAGHDRISSERKKPANFADHRACGQVTLLHRKYRIEVMGNQVILSVFGVNVWITTPTGKTISLVFRGLSPEVALGRFYQAIRVYLEPVGDIS